MHGKYGAWDPEGWYDKETDYYYQISGGDVAGFFRSRDMRDWEYLGDFIDQKDRLRHDFEDLSCPDFFSIGNKHMLVFISHNLGSQYYLGEFKNGRYKVESHRRMNWAGGTFFAPEQLVDDKGRNIIWGWVLERKPEIIEWAQFWDEEGENPQRYPEEGWSGIMSLPRVISLSNEGEVLINPPNELAALRLQGSEMNNVKLEPKTDLELEMRGKSLEIKVEFEGAASSYGVKIFSSKDGREETVIKYDPSQKEVVIDFSKSSASANGQVAMLPNCMFEPKLEGFTEKVSEQRVPFELGQDENLQFDIFIDRSIVEFFVNGRKCITQVVYPELEDSDRVKLFSDNVGITVVKAQVWSMAQINMY